MYKEVFLPDLLAQTYFQHCRAVMLNINQDRSSIMESIPTPTPFSKDGIQNGETLQKNNIEVANRILIIKILLYL